MIRKQRLRSCRLIHPEKYNGDPHNVKYFSTGELNFTKFLDKNHHILEWASEIDDSVTPNTTKYWIKYVTKHGELLEKITTAPDIPPTQPVTPPTPPKQKTNKRPYKQGLYTPVHPEKYKGDPNKIRFMSSWELSFDKFLDNNPNVLEWGSEIISIPYIKPTTGRIHKYYPDYWIKYKTKNGKLLEEIVEVKPEKETKQPAYVGKNKKTQAYEQLMWAINTAKWEAAASYCKKRGIKFRLVTEKHLFK